MLKEGTNRCFVREPIKTNRICERSFKLHNVTACSTSSYSSDMRSQVYSLPKSVPHYDCYKQPKTVTKNAWTLEGLNLLIRNLDDSETTEIDCLRCETETDNKCVVFIKALIKTCKWIILAVLFWNTAKWLFFASAWGLSSSFSYAVITKGIKRI